jgi:predicted GNAT family acetyltransferase
MRLTSYRSAGEFLRVAQAPLEEDEVTNALMLGICGQLIDDPDRYKSDPYLATVSLSHELVFAAIMTPPHKLIVSSVRDDYAEAPELVVLDLLESGWSVPGVLGPLDAALDFAEVWSDLTGAEYRQGMLQRLYKLTKVIAPVGTPGELRVATPNDIDLLVDWIDRFHRDALGQGPIGIGARELAEARVRDRKTYLWHDEGTPVSMAAETRPVSRGTSVSLVYTPPEHRRKGYATACVAALSQLLLDEGHEYCTLYTDLSNPTSNSIYQKVGYVPVGDFVDYFFGPGVRGM